jgi:predicted phosphodiesterase
MIYAIISDIHGNLEALEAVLESLSREKIDKVICIGDIVGYGADPSECMKKTRALDPVIVLGNHDAACIDMTHTRYFNDVARDAILWTRERLGSDDVEFLKKLRLVYKNKDLTMVHGTLQEPEVFHYLFDKHMASETFGLMKTRVCFVGHSHVPGIFSYTGKNNISYFYKEKMKLAKNNRAIINVGSIGQPRDGDPRLCYCVYDASEKRVELKKISYDVEKAQRKILKAGLPPFLAHRLSEGM